MPIVLERKHQRAVVRRFSAASRRSPWFLIGAATLLLAGALGAGPPAIDAGPSGAASGPIVIGFVCTCSGPTASANVVAPPAYQAWADATNAAGGINGRRVEVISVDDQASPSIGTEEVKTLITQDHVVALVSWSLVDAAWGPVAIANHIPVIGANPGGSLSLSSPDFFNTGTTEDAGTVASLQAVKKAGGQLGIFYCVESPQCSSTIPTIKKLAPKYDVTVAYTTGIGFAAPNYTAQCLAAKSAGVTALSVADASLIVQRVAVSCDQQGFLPTVVGGDGSLAANFVETPLLKDKILGYEPDVPFFVTNTPGTRAMLSAFKKYEPAMLASSNYGETAVQSWVSGLVLAAAARAGKLGVDGAPTSAELVHGMYAIPRGSTMGDMTPPLSYKKGQLSHVLCWYWIATKDGHWVTPYGLHTSCA